MHNMEVQTFFWQGIKIELKVSVPYSCYRKTYGHDMYHIEVSSIEPERAPLPISETGYRSIWLQEPQLEEFSGALAYVTEFLNHEAKSNEWKQQHEETRQYQLF